jgi:CheY-like chemotaxis protein
MLKILIVEDDAPLATTLHYLVEDNPRYRVVATARDSAGALEQAERHAPDLALVDLHLANGSTGFAVAARLNDLAIPSLFVSGKAPAFPMPDLALGCLLKPFTAEDVHRSLALAEDRLRGRQTLRPRVPANFTMYEQPAPEAASAEEPGPAARPSWRARLEQWIAGRPSPA